MREGGREGELVKGALPTAHSVISMCAYPDRLNQRETHNVIAHLCACRNSDVAVACAGSPPLSSPVLFGISLTLSGARLAGKDSLTKRTVGVSVRGVAGVGKCTHVEYEPRSLSVRC